MPKKQADDLGLIAPYLLPTEGPGRDDMRQLYSWDFDDAIKANEEWESSNMQGRGPFYRWVGAQELKELYKLYRTGKRAALIIEALYICSLNSLPIPRWCEMAFLASYRKVRQYKAKSWNDVFGRPHPKGMHLETKREEQEKSLRVYQRIKEKLREDPTIPIDGYLFETVGKEFGTGGKTKTEQWYYKWKNKLKI